jgi:hypothetical protein
MSTYPGPDDSQRFGAEPQRTGMSSGTKWLLGLGIGCGVVVLLCCGGIVGLGYFGARFASQSIVENPAEVVAISNEIATIDVPPELKPTMALPLKMPFTGQPIMTMVVYSEAGANKGEGALFLAEFFGPYESTDQKKFQQQMEDALSKQGRKKGEIEVAESRQLQLDIHGEPASFVIQKGEDRDSHRKAVQAVGTFKGKHGTAVLVLQLDADKHTTQEVEKILRSIK